MARRFAGPFLRAALLVLALATPLDAQTVIFGRVEDAEALAPIAGARVIPADSSFAMITDELGYFVLQFAPGAPLSFQVERIGYTATQVDLESIEASTTLVVRLVPEPIVLDAIEASVEGAITEYLGALQARRNSFLGSVRALDRTWISRFAPVGSALDLVFRMVPRLTECTEGKSGLCLPARGINTLQGPTTGLSAGIPLEPVTVCVDRWESFGAVTELSTLDLSAVTLVEIFAMGRGGIRVYTAGHVLRNARDGFNVAPLGFGC